jgi:hypothetical protein
MKSVYNAVRTGSLNKAVYASLIQFVHELLRYEFLNCCLYLECKVKLRQQHTTGDDKWLMPYNARCMAAICSEKRRTLKRDRKKNYRRTGLRLRVTRHGTIHGHKDSSSCPTTRSHWPRKTTRVNIGYRYWLSSLQLTLAVVCSTESRSSTICDQ